MQQIGSLQISKTKIIIILIKNNIFVLKLITSTGVFYKIILNWSLSIINLQQHFVLKNCINDKNLGNVCLSFLIKNGYTLFYYKRYYLKLKGLGFSFKYLTIPHHNLLLNIGFSKMRYIKIPQIISIIKKPRKKKYIFILLSTNFNILLVFTTLLRKLKTPDPYKIKGFRYIQESIKVKTGKKKK